MTDPFAPWVVALTHTGFGAGLPLSGRDWWPLFDPPPTSPSEIEFRISRSANPAVRAISDRKTQLEPELEALEAEGIVALTMFDRAFPRHWVERLGPRVPPVLFLRGNLETLDMPALAIVGSRDAAEPALAFAGEAARVAVAQNRAVVTGGANGVDTAAVAAAVQAGGKAIVIVADEMAEVERRLVRAGIEGEQILFATPSHPASGWSVGKAMGRNKLIYALAESAVVAACETNTGGTWNGATEAIRMAYCPVCVWIGEGAPPGNRELANEGANGISAPDEAFDQSTRSAGASLFE